MIDAPDVLRDFLLTQPSITAMLSTRIWAEMTYPPTGYKPSMGAALVFKTRSAAGLDTTGAILHNSWQCKFYGADIYIARSAYRTVADVLFDAALFGATFESGMEGDSQSIPEPVTDWPVVVAFFETWMYSGLPLYSPTG